MGFAFAHTEAAELCVYAQRRCRKRVKKCRFFPSEKKGRDSKKKKKKKRKMQFFSVFLEEEEEEEEEDLEVTSRERRHRQSRLHVRNSLLW